MPGEYTTATMSAHLQVAKHIIIDKLNDAEAAHRRCVGKGSPNDLLIVFGRHFEGKDNRGDVEIDVGEEHVLDGLQISRRGASRAFPRVCLFRV